MNCHPQKMQTLEIYIRLLNLLCLTTLESISRITPPILSNSLDSSSRRTQGGSCKATFKISFLKFWFLIKLGTQT